jgi:DNA repair protein RadC
MRIADLPAHERPRERLAAVGAAGLTERELLAVLLGSGGAPGVGAHRLAERLLARFGSVTELARAHPAELALVPGIGPVKAATLSAAFELGRRVRPDPTPNTITAAADLVAVVAPLLRGRTRERMVVVSCDGSGRVIGCDVLSEGAADHTLLPVREALVAVLRRDGQTFWLAHNHPAGQAAASRADVEATVTVQRAAATAGLRLSGHVVVTDSDWCEVVTPPVRRTTTLRSPMPHRWRQTPVR